MTVRFGAATEGEPWIRVMIRQCVYCRRPIRWMSTYEDGLRRCFDGDPVPRDLDDGTGWVPAPFPVRGQERLVLAPLTILDQAKRDRARMVMHRHICLGGASAA